MSSSLNTVSMAARRKEDINLFYSGEFNNWLLDKIQDVTLELNLTEAGATPQLKWINRQLGTVKWSTGSHGKQIAVKYVGSLERNEREELKIGLFHALHLRSDHIVEHYAYRVLQKDFNGFAWHKLTFMGLCEGTLLSCFLKANHRQLKATARC